MTHLSAAFETIDIEFLLQKLKPIRIRGKELELFRTSLSNRKQMIEIDILDQPS